MYDLSPTEMARLLEQFFANHPHAAVLEDGHPFLEMANARYSVSATHGRCVLHLWSEEQSMIRIVVGVEVHNNTLRVRVHHIGTQRPQSLEVVPQGPKKRRTAEGEPCRVRYRRLLERVLSRQFKEFKTESLRSAMDVEHTFGPAYARGLLVGGQQCWALIGVNAEETQSTIDGVLTVGILWLNHCRKHRISKKICQGLKVFLPAGCGGVTRARMAWLSREVAQWELFELREAEEDLLPIDATEQGDLKVYVEHTFSHEAALGRARKGLDRIMQLIPAEMLAKVTISPRSSSEVAVCLYGLEFARVRQRLFPGTFELLSEVTFGLGVEVTPLQPETQAGFVDLMQRLFESRCPEGNAHDPLFRVDPEAWLQSVLGSDLAQVDDSLGVNAVYQQVPTLAQVYRRTVDLLTATRLGRLAVLELRTEEDLHLPLLGLDYWIHVNWLHQQRSSSGSGGFHQNGNFLGVPLLPDPPLLYFIVPALQTHPSMDIVLRHLSPTIDWTLIALRDGWRCGMNVVSRRQAPVRHNRVGML